MYTSYAKTYIKQVIHWIYIFTNPATRSTHSPTLKHSGLNEGLKTQLLELCYVGIHGVGLGKSFTNWWADLGMENITTPQLPVKQEFCFLCVESNTGRS